MFPDAARQEVFPEPDEPPAVGRLQPMDGCDDMKPEIREETGEAGSVYGRKPERNKREGFMGFVWLLVFIGVWVLLQAVVLPKMGVST